MLVGAVVNIPTKKSQASSASSSEANAPSPLLLVREELKKSNLIKQLISKTGYENRQMQAGGVARLLQSTGTPKALQHIVLEQLGLRETGDMTTFGAFLTWVNNGDEKEKEKERAAARKQESESSADKDLPSFDYDTAPPPSLQSAKIQAEKEAAANAAATKAALGTPSSSSVSSSPKRDKWEEKVDPNSNHDMVTPSEPEGEDKQKGIPRGLELFFQSAKEIAWNRRLSSFFVNVKKAAKEEQKEEEKQKKEEREGEKSVVMHRVRQVILSTPLMHKFRDVDPEKELTSKGFGIMLSHCGVKAADQKVVMEELELTSKESTIKCGKFVKWCAGAANATTAVMAVSQASKAARRQVAPKVATPATAAMAPKVAPTAAAAANVDAHNNLIVKNFRTKFLASSLVGKIQAMDSNKELSFKKLKKMLESTNMTLQDQTIILDELGLKTKKSTITCRKFLLWCGAAPAGVKAAAAAPSKAAPVAAPTAASNAVAASAISEPVVSKVMAPTAGPKVAPTAAAAAAAAANVDAHNNLIVKNFRTKFLASSLVGKIQAMDSNKELSFKKLKKMLESTNMTLQDQTIILDELGLKTKKSTITCRKFLLWCGAAPAGVKAAAAAPSKAAPVAAPTAAAAAAKSTEPMASDTFRKKFLASKLNEKMKKISSSKVMPYKMIKKLLEKLDPHDQTIILDELGLKGEKSTITCGKFMEWCNT